MSIEESSPAATEANGDTTGWQAAPINELIAHICHRHHVYLKSELPKLAKMAGLAAPRDPFLAALHSVILELKGELESHMWKEEVVLFPLILNLVEAERNGTPPPPAHCGSVKNPIRVMEMEHAGAKNALDEIARLASCHSADAQSQTALSDLLGGLRDLDADLRRHIHLEDDILFPRAARLEAGISAQPVVS